MNNTYDLARNKTVFKNLGLQDARKAVQSKQVSALLVVIPLTGKYIALVKGFFPQGTKATPVLIPIDSAAAIADSNRAYESFDVPKGTLRGSPPVPDDDLTTLEDFALSCRTKEPQRRRRNKSYPEHLEGA
ncbi:hypothetical protein [Bradyrhizobium sp. BR 1433]|uniref:hypothetical protein n=1 Tax=Bradyrhizobium sp. BR 1433 TaxID=3447967 RepID=UPI003EE4C4BD